MRMITQSACVVIAGRLLAAWEKAENRKFKYGIQEQHNLAVNGGKQDLQKTSGGYAPSNFTELLYAEGD